MTARRGWGGTARCAVAVCALVAAPSTHIDAQPTHRLQSRAAFAALDSTALADSSAMVPLDPHARLDSLMLDMWAVLEQQAVSSLGMRPSRIRKWNGFGSQAHPTVGVLVDRDEVDTLLTKVRVLKGMAHVAPEEITRRAEWAVRFLVAHEHAHLVQYHVFGADSVENPASTRIIECGADIFGGYQYQRYLDARALSDSVPPAARAAAEDFGYVIGSNDWLDGTAHPLPENRHDCIGTGMSAAAGMDALAGARRGAGDSLADPRVRWLTEREPVLRAGRISAIEWSRVRARELAAVGAVVGGSMELAVVRDTSLGTLVRHLAALAEQGSTALRALRSDLAPGAASTYLLREALPPPWQCSIATVNGVEQAECRYTTLTGATEAKALVSQLRERVRVALESDGWGEANAAAQAAATAGDPGRGFQHVFFTRGGKDPGNPSIARVDVFRGDVAPQSAIQSPPSVTLGFAVRANSKR